MARRLILASASPRRRELLGLLGLPFEVAPSDVEEDGVGDLAPAELAERLARDKAAAVWRGAGADALVLAADTVVAVGEAGSEHVLGKPADAADARRMLALLSGRGHTVYTGVAVASCTPDRSACCLDGTHVATEVVFRPLTPAMIDAYVATGEPFDKAGAYGIQGFASAFVEAVYGDYFNVVGLPVQTVCRMLERVGVEWWRGREALGR